MDSPQKNWNKRQTQFREILLSFNQHDQAIRLFLHQHAALHTAQMASAGTWSFEDEVLNDMQEEQIRRIPQNCEHSVAWAIWHIARIEDTTMNMLVADKPQILYSEGWFDKLEIEARDTGNAMSDEGVAALSTAINIEALRAYRMAVGRRTRDVVKQLSPSDLSRKVEPARLQQVLDEGAVVAEAQGLIDYWSKRNIAGLLLMPATRHNFVHLNEAMKLKKRR
jgi:hypothetical protein